MIRNYLKIGWRNLKNQPFFTFLNTLGLAVGMAGVLLIVLYITNEFAYNNTFSDADRIYRVETDISFGGKAQEYAVVVAPFAETVQREFPVVEEATRFRTQGSMLVRRSETVENQKEAQSTYADPNFIEFFGLPLIEGDAPTALAEPNTVVLSQKAASKYFGTNSPIGESIVVNNGDLYRVTGVIADLPSSSFLRNYSVFMSMEGYPESKDMGNWGSNNFNTFIKLIPHAETKDLTKSFEGLIEKYLLPYAQSFMPGATKESMEKEGIYVKYSATPLLQLHLAGNRVAEMNANNNIETIYILSFVALFLIILAVVNFMNLSTAQSLKRAKEVGIRKTLGSEKSGLIAQFLTESVLLSFLSMIVALLIAVLFSPLFNQLTGNTVSIPFSNPIFWGVIIAATLVLGILAGSYPAFILSRFIPVKVLKGNGKTTEGGRVRNSLVVFQFMVSVFLIVCTLVVYHQLSFIQNKDLGYTKDQILVIDDVYAAGNKLETFKKEVQKLPGVSSTTLSSFLPTPSNRSDNGFELQGPEPKQIQMQTWNVDYDYVETLGLNIIKGRNFDKKFGTDSSAIIVNETALKILGLQPEQAIGTVLSQGGIHADTEVETYTIIGLINNFHFESFKDKIGALALTVSPGYKNKLAVKLNAGDFKAVIAQIKGQWESVASGQPFNHYFMDDSFNETYAAEQRLGSIFMTFTVLSLLVACLGLFGLAAFNAQKRTKEIGIRKVMGASVNQIAVKLSKDFLKLVGISIALALPISWLAMNRWLQDFTYRIDIDWWILALAAFSAIAIAILTVSFQAIKAAVANPVKSLRSE